MRPLMKPSARADLRFVLGLCAALAVLTLFVLLCHDPIFL